MKKLFLTTAGLMFFIVVVKADEKYSHFPSLKAPTTNVALCNLAAYNEKLQIIVNKEKLTPEDMVKVHELTYTLENAIIRLQKDLVTIAIDLENVHKASERLDEKIIKGSGDKYISASNVILETKVCK